jgi:hypothetical protein
MSSDLTLTWTARPRTGLSAWAEQGSKEATVGATTFTIVRAHARAPFSLYFSVGDQFQLVGNYGSEWDAAQQAEVVASKLTK